MATVALASHIRKTGTKSRVNIPAAGKWMWIPLLLLSGCGLGGPAHSPPASDVAAAVDMGFHSYSPETVTIRAGETVEWRNTSLITHTVTDDPKLAKHSADAALPAGAAALNSGNIPPGQIYKYAFTVPGTYRYFCTHHEDHGMVGMVIVRPASSLPLRE